MTPTTPGRRRAGGVAAAIGALALSLALAGAWSGSGSRDPAASLAVQAKGGVLAARADTGAPFRVATFNILGSQHTRGVKQYARGTKRAATTAALVQAKNIDLIGMQEVQADQLSVLRKGLAGFQVWPRKTLGGDGVRLQIAWRRSMFSLVDKGSQLTPFDGLTRPMPWVALRHHGTGRTIYVVNTHNSPRGKEAERDAATDAQLTLLNQLRASKKAVLFLGDMNEKREIFCRVVSKTSLLAANGGSARSKRDCTLPSRPDPLRIDWIFGGGPLAFVSYRVFDGAEVRRASDHALIRAQVSLRPRRQ